MEIFVLLFILVRLCLLVRLDFWFDQEHALIHEPCFKTQISARGAQHIHARVESMQKGLLAERTTSPNQPRNYVNEPLKQVQKKKSPN